MLNLTGICLSVEPTSDCLHRKSRTVYHPDPDPRRGMTRLAAEPYHLTSSALGCGRNTCKAQGRHKFW
jgi:hypothetical protein